jgi:hypothetical protein
MKRQPDGIIDICVSCKKWRRCLGGALRATKQYAVDPAFIEQLRQDLLKQFKEKHDAK